jgi:hypothetical protein
MHRKAWRITALMQIKRDVKQKKIDIEKNNQFFFILSWKIESFLAEI